MGVICDVEDGPEHGESMIGMHEEVDDQLHEEPQHQSQQKVYDVHATSLRKSQQHVPVVTHYSPHRFVPVQAHTSPVLV